MIQENNFNFESKESTIECKNCGAQIIAKLAHQPCHVCDKNPLKQIVSKEEQEDLVKIFEKKT